MKHLAILFLCLVPSFVHAGGTLKEARQEWLEGYYAEARDSFEMLAKNPKTRRDATLGLSRVLESIGEYDKAQTALESLLKDNPKDADVLARLGQLHFLRGRFENAEKSAQAALAESKDHFLAHWVLAQIYRDSGDQKKADEEFLWFVRASNRLDITDPDSLVLTGLAGLERARNLHLNDQFQKVISNYFRADAITKDKHYWQGEYEAGRVYMEKHDKPKAFKAFEKAMTINPLAPEVLVARGQMAANSMEFQVSEKNATLALKTNPRYVPALLLMADVHWFSGELDATLKLLDRAKAVNPRDEAMLARFAACRFAQEKKDEFQALIKEARKNNPICYTFYTNLGSLLAQRKNFGDAEKYYKIAADMQPKLAEAQSSLGQLYMFMAKEAEARKVFEKASAADPFNVKVFNSLLVLDHLDKYHTLETDHFILRFDAKNDRVLANFMAVYLEDIYKELKAQFDYEPPGKVKIQIFSRHEMFSGRVVAVPDLHTVGACSGPMVAMVSTHDTSKFIGKAFNWNRVMRHELVHVFNLQQTAGKVPHWFTEGLAVRYEGSHIPPSWHALLADKYNNNELLNLDTILLGFIRPRSQLQWQQAYLQSLLYVEYLAKTHGEKSIGKMLAAFQDGLSTDAALVKACGVKKDAFEKGYRAFLGERVKNTPARPVQKEMTLKQLQAAHAKNPDDADIAAQLAAKYFAVGSAKQRKEGKEIVEKILDKTPKHPLAVSLKSLMLLDEKRFEDAFGLLESVDTDDLKDATPLKLLVKMQLELKKFDKAVATCEHARKIDPHDTVWMTLLRDLYKKTMQDDKLIEISEEVAKVDPDDLVARRLVARHYLDKGKHAEAERFARMGLEIDVKDPECRQIILEALPALNRQEEADRLKKIFGL